MLKAFKYSAALDAGLNKVGTDTVAWAWACAIAERAAGSGSAALWTRTRTRGGAGFALHTAFQQGIGRAGEIGIDRDGVEVEGQGVRANQSQVLVPLTPHQNVRPSTTFALIQELIHRDGLRIALSGRDETTLEPILVFLVRHVTDPRFGELASEVAGVIIGE